jgi:hypothetical protein
MNVTTNPYRQAASHKGPDFMVTFVGRSPILVESISPITGDHRAIWREGRPMGDLTRAAVGNARMRDTRGDR